ncbi:hypothetical protein AB1N83_012197 [Pleurotus pulmonarius]
MLNLINGAHTEILAVRIRNLVHSSHLHTELSFRLWSVNTNELLLSLLVKVVRPVVRNKLVRRSSTRRGIQSMSWLTIQRRPVMQPAHLNAIGPGSRPNTIPGPGCPLRCSIELSLDELGLTTGGQTNPNPCGNASQFRFEQLYYIRTRIPGPGCPLRCSIELSLDELLARVHDQRSGDPGSSAVTYADTSSLDHRRCERTPLIATADSP